MIKPRRHPEKIMNPPVKFSVVVPACGRPGQLAQCLARLAPGAQTWPVADYEVIVTDDSADDSVQSLVQAQFRWAQWAAGPRRGPAANRNSGARRAKYDWLAFTDDDCLPEPGWLAAFGAQLQAVGEAAPDLLEGRTYADRPQRSLAERAPINTNGGYLWSCNLAVRRELFERLGGFDEGFPYASMEDVDLAMRLRASGAREIFVPLAGVCHPWREIAGFGAMWTAEQKHLASVRYFLAKHPEERSHHTPLAYFKNNARQLVRSTLPGLCRWRGRGFPAALAWHLHTLRKPLALRRPGVEAAGSP